MLQHTRQSARPALPNWRRRFGAPIPANGKWLYRLVDVKDYIASLPAAEQQASAWKTAAKLLMQVAEHGAADLTPTRVAIMRALHGGRAAPRRRRAKYTLIR
jgi:hypothetical protein